MEEMKDDAWHELVIEYLANPLDNRPIVKFCDESNIPRASYYYYIKHNRKAIDAEVDRRRKEYFGELRQRFYKVSANRMQRSDRILQMMGEMLGEYIPKSEQKVEYHTPEQKREKAKTLLNDILKKVQDKNKADKGGI